MRPVLKAHRTTTSIAAKREAWPPDWTNEGRPTNLFVTDGQVSDYIEALALLSSIPNVDWLLGNRGYDADWFQDALKRQGDTRPKSMGSDLGSEQHVH